MNVGVHVGYVGVNDGVGDAIVAVGVDVGRVGVGLIPVGV